MFSKLRCIVWRRSILIQNPIVKLSSTGPRPFSLLGQSSFKYIFRFASSSSISLPLTTQKTAKRKKLSANDKVNSQDHFSVIGMALGSHFNLTTIQKSFVKNQLFKINPLPEEFCEALVLSLRHPQPDMEPSDVFLFRNGTAVLWNVDQGQTKQLRQLLAPHLSDRYEEHKVETEAEMFSYRYSDGHRSGLSEDIITFRNASDRQEILLEKYSYSDALALSVKLGILESQFYEIVGDIEPWIERLKSGGSLWGLNQAKVLKMTGELFTLRHLINVESDLTVTPDAYWENAKLERLFSRMKSVLTLDERCQDMNEKLNLCCEFMDLLSSHLHAQRSTRLEIMIIVLISVEVIFQFYHFFESRKKNHVEPHIH